MNNRWSQNTVSVVCSVVVFLSSGCGQTSHHATNSTGVVSVHPNTNDKGTNQDANANRHVQRSGSGEAVPDVGHDKGFIANLFGQVDNGANTSVNSVGPNQVGGGKTQDSVHQKPAKNSLPQSEAKIVNEAVTQLQQLRGYYVSQIDALYSAAMNDHRTHRLTASQIASKYMPRAMQLSNASQDQVNGVLFSLKRKLQNGGFPTTEVDVLRNEYDNEVRSKVSELEGKTR